MINLKVKIISDSHDNDYKEGDEGYISGYVTNNNIAYACVVIRFSIVLVRLHHLIVVESRDSV